jgi:hypothetical protein
MMAHGSPLCDQSLCALGSMSVEAVEYFESFGFSLRPIRYLPTLRPSPTIISAASKSQHTRVALILSQATTVVRMQAHCATKIARIMCLEFRCWRVCAVTRSGKSSAPRICLKVEPGEAMCSFHMLDENSNHTTLRRSIPLRILGILST